MSLGGGDPRVGPFFHIQSLCWSLGCPRHSGLRVSGLDGGGGGGPWAPRSDQGVLQSSHGLPGWARPRGPGSGGRLPLPASQLRRTGSPIEGSLLGPLPWFVPAHPKATSSGQIQPPAQEAAPGALHKLRGHTQLQLPWAGLCPCLSSHFRSPVCPHSSDPRRVFTEDRESWVGAAAPRGQMERGSWGPQEPPDWPTVGVLSPEHCRCRGQDIPRCGGGGCTGPCRG